MHLVTIAKYFTLTGNIIAWVVQADPLGLSMDQISRSVWSFITINFGHMQVQYYLWTAGFHNANLVAQIVVYIYIYIEHQHYWGVSN